jgi:hypothetical protein
MRYDIVVLQMPEGEKVLIQRTDIDGTVWTIPEDPDNIDYQEYLAQLEEGES